MAQPRTRRRGRIPAIAIAAAVLLSAVALSSASAQALAAPVRAGQTTSEASWKVLEPQVNVPLAIPDGCARVRADLGRYAARGLRRVACVGPAGPRVVAALPSLCHPLRQEFDRFADCLFAGWILTIIAIPSGEVVGTVTGATILWNSLAFNRRSWTEHIRIEVAAVTGEGSATRFTAPVVCSPGSAGCQHLGGIWAGQHGFLAARIGAVYSGGQMFDSPGTATDEMAIQVDMLFETPAANPAALTIGPAEKVRCDSQDIFRPTKGGCVFKNATENILEIFRSDGTVTDAALFMRAAQRTIHNHAGWFGHGIALTRLTTRATIRRNRRVACRNVRLRRGQTCDEYPFASTNQGASLVPRADWESAGVPGAQNSKVGTYLSRFLLRLRIAAGDSYYVQIS